MTAQTPERDGGAEADHAGIPDGIDPEKLDMLADWFDLDDARKGHTGPFDVQADLRRWAQLVREEKLRRLGPDAEPQPSADLRQLLRDARPHVAYAWRESADAGVRDGADAVLTRMTEAGVRAEDPGEPR